MGIDIGALPATGPGSSIVARLAWEPVRIVVLLGMDSWDTFEKIYLEINLYLEVLSSIFVKNLFFSFDFTKESLYHPNRTTFLLPMGDVAIP